MQLLAGRYHLTEAVGRGGMAIVYRAHDRVLQRQVAVKVLSPGRCREEDLRDAVRREALAAARLSHPNIAAVYDYGETSSADDRRPFLVMEFVPGGTLAERLAAGGRLAWPEAAEICAGIGAALASAHHDQLVHRDIKPANIMLSPTGVKVVDFGVATAAGQSAVDAHGRIWGTPSFLAPEQLRHETLGPAADVYALGLVLHTCLTGGNPWPGRTREQVLSARRAVPTPLLPDLPSLPAEVADLREACLADEPDMRPAAHEVAQLLGRVAADAGRPPSPGTTVPSPPRTTAVLTVSVGRRARSAAAVGVPAAAIGAVLATQLVTGASPEAAAGGPVSGVRAAACSIRYAGRLTAGGTFEADLAVVNTGRREVTGVVTFDLPTGQRLTRTSAPRWSQTSGTVRLTTPAGLAAGTSSTFALHGTYDPRHPDAPTAFTLDGVGCDRAATSVTIVRERHERGTTGRASPSGGDGHTAARDPRNPATEQPTVPAVSPVPSTSSAVPPGSSSSASPHPPTPSGPPTTSGSPTPTGSSGPSRSATPGGSTASTASVPPSGGNGSHGDVIRSPRGRDAGDGSW